MQTIWSVLYLLQDSPVYVILSACGLNFARIMSYKSQDWTGTGPHPASCTMGTGTLLEIKRPGRVVYHPPHLVRWLRRNRGSVPPLCLHGLLRGGLYLGAFNLFQEEITSPWIWEPAVLFLPSIGSDVIRSVLGYLYLFSFSVFISASEALDSGTGG